MTTSEIVEGMTSPSSSRYVVRSSGGIVCCCVGLLPRTTGKTGSVVGRSSRTGGRVAGGSGSRPFRGQNRCNSSLSVTKFPIAAVPRYRSGKFAVATNINSSRERET